MKNPLKDGGFWIIVFVVVLALLPAELWFVNHFIYDFGYEP